MGACRAASWHGITRQRATNKTIVQKAEDAYISIVFLTSTKETYKQRLRPVKIQA